MTNGSKVIVCQHGSRHRYAIPRMLEEEGVLEAFYTDSSAESRIGKIMALFANRDAFQSKLDRWDVLGIPREKIHSSDLPFLCERFRTLLSPSIESIQLYRVRHQALSARMKKWGVKDADMVYSMYHENLDFVRFAKARGLLSVVDVFVSPLTEQIMEEEISRFPDWGGGLGRDSVRLLSDLWEQTASLADILLCPSEWVAEGVCACTPAASGKVRIVPYGCSMNYGDRVNNPTPGRVLFAGRDPLRKGLHYLAQAATALKQGAPGDMDIRVAGPMPVEVVGHPVCKDLNFLGQLDKSRMIEEYLAADVFVLPALSEGFAGVVAEAIGAGCPVVVTREAGSPVQHGREGLVIPSRDVDALAGAMFRLTQDRDVRSNCAGECLKQREFYSEKSWRARLVGAIGEGNGS